jgi:hypothetical protein
LSEHASIGITGQPERDDSSEPDSVVSPAWTSRGPRRSEGDARRRGWTKSEPPPRADVSDGRARVYDACVRRTSRRVAACGEATTRVACALPSDEAPRGVYSHDARARRANARLGGQKQGRARRRDEFPGRAGQDRARGRPRVRPRRVFAARFKTPDAALTRFFRHLLRSLISLLTSPLTPPFTLNPKPKTHFFRTAVTQTHAGRAASRRRVWLSSSAPTWWAPTRT